MKKKLHLILILILINTSILAQEYIVSSIQFEGSKKTNISFLKQLIHTKENETLIKKVLDEDITRLIRLPVIANASYNIVKNKNKCTIAIKLQENITLIPIANLFQTNNEEIAYSLGLYEHNLFKRSISAGVWYQKNVFDSYGFDFRAPFLFSANFGLSVNFANLATKEPVFFNSGTAQYKYNNISTEVLGLYQINFKHKVTAGVNFFEEIYTPIDITDVPEAPGAFSLDKILFKGTYTYDNRKFNYQYISGFKSEFNLQYVIAPNEIAPNETGNNFIVGWNDLLYFKRIQEKGNWASRLRIGLAQNDETPFAPFSVDNNLNLRGVGNKIDRGTGVIVLNTEYRHTLLDKNSYAFQGNLFIDAGTWRNPGGDFNDFTDTNNVRVFPGAGFRFIHKRIFNLILRADFGYGITENEPFGIVFGVGQYF